MIPIDLTQFTKTEQKILRLLADGQFHSGADIGMRCSCGWQGSTIKARVHLMRKKLAKHSDSITIETSIRDYVPLYRLIRPVELDDSLFIHCPRIDRSVS